MPNNKQEILSRGEDRVVVSNDNQGDSVLDLREALVKGPIKVDKGLFRRFRVYEGTEAIVLIDGQHRETLQPGGYFTMAYPIFQQLELYVVDTRDRNMDVHVWDDLRIAYRTPSGDEIAIPISLRISVTYRVADTRIVALQINMPLGNLYDFVVEAMRVVVARTRYQDFQYGGNAGQLILQQLQQRGLDTYLGIEVVNVQIASIGGAEVIDSTIVDGVVGVTSAQNETRVLEIQEEARRRLELQDALNRADISKAISLTPGYVLRYHPDMYDRIFGNQAQTDALRMQALVDLIRSGMLSPGQLGTASQLFLDSSPERTAPNLLPSGSSPSEGATTQFISPLSGRERVLADAQELHDAGIRTEVSEGNGLLAVIVLLQDSEGHSLTIYLDCPPNYPHIPPAIFVELDGEQQQFRPLCVDQWHPTMKLSVPVREIINAFS
jgi:hypothetical protein